MQDNNMVTVHYGAGSIQVVVAGTGMHFRTARAHWEDTARRLAQLEFPGMTVRFCYSPEVGSPCVPNGPFELADLLRDVADHVVLLWREACNRCA